MNWKRVERVHWMSGGKQLLISHPEHLTVLERAECPPGLIASFHAWPKILETLPETLKWAHGGLRARKPVLERSLHNGDRLYWALRYPMNGKTEHLEEVCFGTSTGGVSSDAPGLLGWLARTFGHVDLCSEWSGTAPWGQRLGKAAPPVFREYMLPELPDGAADWWALYEVDGDWVALNADGAPVWVGPEWTGHAMSPLPPSAERTLSFLFWRLLEGGFVQPTDLEMLGR